MTACWRDGEMSDRGTGTRSTPACLSGFRCGGLARCRPWGAAPAGSASASQEGLGQVVPVAVGADLDDVAGPATLASCELQALLHFEGPPVVALKAVGVDVGEE